MEEWEFQTRLGHTRQEAMLLRSEIRAMRTEVGRIGEAATTSLPSDEILPAPSDYVPFTVGAPFWAGKVPL